MSELSRERYAALYGPTTGDRIRLADTDLLIEVTEDRSGPGDEAVFGGGKVIRESMGQSVATRAEGTPDLVITGAVVLDHWGVVKADVGVRDGRIVALGKAGNPDITDGVDPRLVIGPSTEVLAGNGLILTAGGVDCHVHLICPQIVDEALAAGITTLIGGGTGPAEGTRATTVTPGSWYARPDAGGARRLAGQRRLARQGQHDVTRGAPRAAAGRRVGLQAPRGLGLDAGRDRRLPVGRGRDGRPGGAALGHDERGGLRRGHDRGHLREGDPRLPHRGRGWRPRPGHHRPRRTGERASVLDEPDDAPHGQHRRRAPRHADGLPPPEPRVCPRILPSPRAGSVRRRSPRRTSSTTSARSR